MNSNRVSNLLPAPDAAAQALSGRLASAIVERIRDLDAGLPFDEFMRMALYEPGLGYYVNGLQKFGDAGDFITAPGSGDLFGQCLARQCEQVLSVTGGDILEFGAGDGALASQVLAALGDSFNGRYFILELSPSLRSRQAERIGRVHRCVEDRVAWLDCLPEGFTGVVFANEVLDAMPVKRIEHTKSGWRELAVAYRDNEFFWVHKAFTPVSQAYIDSYIPRNSYELGYRTELHTQAHAWIGSIADCLKKGVALLIDYGYSEAEYYRPDRVTGALRCHYRQLAHDDPFWYPGLQDITAHVNFTAIAQSAVDNGLDVLGYTQQAPFLMSLGLLDETKQNNKNTIQMTQRAQEIKRLTMPDQMGELFKVLAVARNFDHELTAMNLQNHLSRL